VHTCTTTTTTGLVQSALPTSLNHSLSLVCRRARTTYVKPTYCAHTRGSRVVTHTRNNTPALCQLQSPSVWPTYMHFVCLVGSARRRHPQSPSVWPTDMHCLVGSARRRHSQSRRVLFQTFVYCGMCLMLCSTSSETCPARVCVGGMGRAPLDGSEAWRVCSCGKSLADTDARRRQHQT
jgi:hypothetical protein